MYFSSKNQFLFHKIVSGKINCLKALNYKMGKKEDVSSEKKAIIQYLLTNKHSSISEISRKCDISRRTLKRIKDKLKMTSNYRFRDKANAGEKRK